jgi:leucine dehydrogenase
MMTEGVGSMADITKNNMTNIKSVKKKRHSVLDSLMRYARMLGYGEIHSVVDAKTGLQGFVAIHNLKRGPAIGGCRMVNYESTAKAMEDAIRLGYMMSYKAAITNLPHGGAKSVLIKPREMKDKEAYFEKFGEFIDGLGGRYITAVDSGTSPAEMDIIARKTKFVSCTSNSGVDSDPSPLTALGVRRAIEAAVKFKMKRDTLENVHVTIQGTGHVGYYLAKELHELGAKLTVTDINPKSIQRCVDEFGASVCKPDEIYSVKADVFAPCALGAILTLENINKLKVGVVAGSANNQLAHGHCGTVMHERGILYAPDFLINAGGLIQVAVLYGKGTVAESIKQVDKIYQAVYEIYERSIAENTATNLIAEQIARDRLK